MVLQTYQERDGKVIFGGRPLGEPPASGSAACAGAKPYARFTRRSSGSSDKLFSALAAADFTTFATRRACGVGR